MRRKCYICPKPARQLFTEPHYKYEMTEPVFCSMRCAAHYALHSATGMADGALHFCSEHGWQAHLFDGEPECESCEVTP